jgi:streptogramin lyase
MVWSGTAGGLCRVNGGGVTVFDDFSQTFNGPMNRDGKGWLYVQKRDFPDSVEVINPATLKVFGARFNDRLRGVFGGMAQRMGKPLYFAQGSSIYAYLPGESPRQVHLLADEIRSGDRLVSATETGYLLYRQTDQTIEEQRNGQSTIFGLPTDLPPGHLHLDKRGVLWFSNSLGTFCKAPDGDFELFLPALTEGKIINFFAEDEQGNMFFGFLDDVLVRVTYLEQVIDGVRRSANWITDIDDRVISISGQDFSEGLRLNTYGGIYVLDCSPPPQRPFRRFLYREVKPGKFGDVMRGFAADDEGLVYANKDSKMPYWFRVDPKSNELDTLTMLKNDGEVVDQWGCGTNLLNYKGDIYGHSCDLDSTETYLGFVYRYRPADDSWKRWPLPEPSHVVRWVTNGRTEDELLLVTEEKKYHQDGHLYYFYPARDSFALIQTSGPETAIRGYTKDVALDEQQNALWIGTNQALYRFSFESEQLLSYVFPDGRPTIISDIFIRKSGLLALATVQNGLQEFDPETGTFVTIGGYLPEGHRAFDKEDFIKLPTDDVATLNLTEDHQLLITTFEGLVLYDKQTGRTTTFTTDEGLANDEFNTVSTFYNPAEGRWYAGGINGFVSFKTEDLQTAPSSYNPALVSYRILDGGNDYEETYPLPTAPLEAITLSPSIIYCAIDFTIPDYLPRGERRYQTKLVGLDPDWTAPTTSNSVRYTGLDPGTYTFQVRAYDGEGRKGATDRRLTIIVLKPFYLQWWFILLAICSTLAFLYGMHRLRMVRLRAKMEGERKVQSLELKSLRQQLNPHFISNAMNAIKEYIQRPEAEDPARYLMDFSLMMRRFLESSRHRFTSIADEVDMLKRYVSLEQLRFPGKFDVVFSIDPALDPEMDEVPSLLLQPIIENAIEHGLRPLDAGGHLRVDFALDHEDDDVIICKVSDNGVGRKIAALRSKSPGHVSRATAILEERQALLASDDEIKLGVAVQDLHPEREHTGTIVTVRIEAS